MVVVEINLDDLLSETKRCRWSKGLYSLFFKEDIKLIKEAGFKSYRFSFAWLRLFQKMTIKSTKRS